MAREIRIVLHARRHRHVGRLGRVALEQRDHVVDAQFLIRNEHVDHEPGESALILARLGEHRHIGRQRPAVDETRRLLVGKWRRKVVSRPAGPLEHIALVVGAVLDLVFRRDRRDLRRGEFRSTLLAEIAERQQRETVTGLANVMIDLEPALELATIELAERAGERPRVAWWLHVPVFLGRGPLRRPDERSGADRKRDQKRGPTAFEQGFRNRARQRLGLLDQAEQRQHDDEVDEVPRGQQAGHDDVTALRRL